VGAIITKSTMEYLLEIKEKVVEGGQVNAGNTYKY